MAGHSKWAQIKRKKAATDAVRSKIFSKFARLITVESKKVRGDVNSPSLRAVIERAKAENMPKDNIERAVAKGADVDGPSYEPVLYETYGPGGVAVLITALTDNSNRTGQEVRLILTKHDCVLANPGSAQWAFTKNPDGGYAPNSTVEISEQDAQKLAALLEALDNHDVQEIYTTAS